MSAIARQDIIGAGAGKHHLDALLLDELADMEVTERGGVGLRLIQVPDEFLQIDELLTVCGDDVQVHPQGLGRQPCIR